MTFTDRPHASQAEASLVATASKARLAAMEAAYKLEPKLETARKLIEAGDYQAVLTLLPLASRELEVRNVYAVCLMRLHRFHEAVELLRPLLMHHSVAKLRDDIPMHIKINFATALFFGGRPAGGMTALQEIQANDHPGVKLVREQARKWIANMSFFRRLDWYLNGVAPKQLPGPPDQPVGYCVWDVD